MSDYETQPEQYLNFNTAEWNIIKTYLKGRQEALLSALCSTLSHDETNVKRGQLMQIRDLLSLEQVAINGRQKE